MLIAGAFVVVRNGLVVLCVAFQRKMQRILDDLHSAGKHGENHDDAEASE